MASYITPAQQVEVGNMMAAMQRPGMVLMQSQQATLASGQHIWVQATPSNGGQQQLQAQQAMARPAFQAVPQQQQQHVTILKQQAVQPTQTMRVVQMANNVQQLQPQPQLVLQAAAPQQQQCVGNNVVYVNVNGTLQRGIVQNGSVYLLNNNSNTTNGNANMMMSTAGNMVQGQRFLAASQQQQQQPVTVTLAGQAISAGSQPGSSPMNGSIVQLPNGTSATLYQAQQPQQTTGGQQMLVQQVAGGARLVPVSQGMCAPPARIQQVLPQQQLSRPMMAVALPAGQQVMMMHSVPAGGAPLAQCSGPMVFAASNQTVSPMPRPQQQLVQAVHTVQAVPAPMPMQQLVPRGPAARPVAMPQPQPQPLAMQQQPQMRPMAAGMGTVMMGNTVANGAVAAAAAASASAAATQSPAAFTPAQAGGPQLLVSGTSVSANTAALMSKVPAAASGTTVVSVNPAQQQQMQPGQQMQLVIPVSGPQGMRDFQAAGNAGPTGPRRAGDLSSPPAPPATPGMAAVPGAGSDGAAPHVPALLDCSPAMNRSGSSGLLGVIGSQRRSKDGAAGVAALRTALPTTSPVGSAQGSQPGTPARNNSGGVLLGDASSATSLPLAAAGCAQAAIAAASDADKAAVMRMMAGSFVETGIALDQALTMIQPSDRPLLIAAFEQVTRQQAAPPAPAGGSSSEACLSSPGKQGGELSGLGDLGGVQISMPPQGGSTKGPLAAGLGLGFGDTCSDTKNGFDSNASLGSWGFSLFAGSDTDKLSSVDAVVVKPSAPFAAGTTASQDLTMTSMLAALNL